MRSDFFKPGSIQSTLMASGGHSLDPAAPLLDQSEFLKCAADDAVAEFGDAFLDFFNRESKEEQARVIDLQAIVKQGDPDRSAGLRVVGMHNRVNDSFAHGHNGKGPQVGSLYRPDYGFASHMLSQECDGFLRGCRKIGPDFDEIHNPSAVAAREPSRLYPSIR